ncbi:MAG TPA: GNAT family N-acetyltransferase, partial [Actinomycetota bacterium]|nr:GNAT family N-acetyltransferase [Actinomycetota bacterium]
MRTLRDAIRRRGLYRRVRHLAGRLSAPLRIARLYVMYRKDLTRRPEPFRARVPIEVTIARPREIDAVAEVNRGATEDLVTIYRGRLEMGGVCFVARLDGRIVGYNWIFTRSLVDFDGERIDLGDGEIFCLDAYTAEEWRGHAIHTELLAHMLRWGHDEGYRTAYTEVSALLRRSWKTHRRL